MKSSLSLKVRFGGHLEDSEWVARGAKASVGEIACGIGGLLAVAEKRLGFPEAPEVPAAERVAAYRRLVAARVAQEPRAWCARSFGVDAWGTAEHLLALRDELLRAGWDGRTAGTPRLEFLASLEPAALPLGTEDRIRRAIAEIDGVAEKLFADVVVELAERRELLPALWRNLLAALERSGATIADVPARSADAKKLVRVSGDDESELALALARRLSRLPAEAQTRTAIVCEGDSSVLDAALTRFGLGVLAFRVPSRHPSQQLFPLFLEAARAPFDPVKLAELFAHPISAFPRGFAFRALRALGADEPRKDEPAGSARCRAFALKKRIVKFFEAPETAKLRLPAARKSDPVPVGNALELCRRFVRLVSAPGRRGALSIARKQAESLIRVLENVGAETISFAELMRAADLVVGAGGVPAGEAQVNKFAAFRHPGAVTGEFDELVWWNFVDTGTPTRTHWDAEEIAVVPGLAPKAEREREHDARLAAVACAKERVLLLTPKRVRGETVYDHPFLPILAQGKPEEVRTIASTDALEDGLWRSALPAASAKTPGDEGAAGQGEPATTEVAVPENHVFSASQLETLLACPFKWTLEKFANLRKGVFLNLPQENLARGKLAHKVVERLFDASKTREDDAAAARARELFDEELPFYLPQLLLAGREGERSVMRDQLAAAVSALVKKIRDDGLEVVGTEQKLLGEIAGHSLTGYVDLLLKKQDGGGNVVFDLKWSSGEKYGEKLTASGNEEKQTAEKSVQLAVYAKETGATRCAYFLFPKQKTLDAKEGVNWGALWDEIEDKVMMELGDLARGTVRLSELADPCKYCDFRIFCGKKSTPKEPKAGKDAPEAEAKKSVGTAKGRAKKSSAKQKKEDA